MADDVSKKDLQGVEARCTKKTTEVANDLKAVAEDLKTFRKEQAKDSEELNTIQVNIKRDLDERCKKIEADIANIMRTVNEHTKIISELQNRKTSIF